MPVSESQVDDPSVAAILFQCQALLERLEQGFIASEYPEEALRIRYLFQLLALRIRTRLLAIQERRERDPVSREMLPLGELAVQQANHLGEVVQTLYACLRYLHASDPRSTPPEIQTAIRRLVEQFAAPILDCQPADVVLLVRPRWTAPNFVDLLRELDQHIEVSDLDPEGEMGVGTLREFIDRCWNLPDAQKECCPKHVAVISFAGLDAQDALDYPLLAHEIGHFIDFSYPGTIHGHSSLDIAERVVTTEEVRGLYDLAYPTDRPSDSLNADRFERVSDRTRQVNQNINTCLREIAADLLAVRMLGISYFIAAAEYLKTVSAWPEEVVTNSGYPGIAFRLRIMFEELTSPEGEIQAIECLGRILATLADGPARRALLRGIDYLKGWGRRLQGEVAADSVGFVDFPTRLNRLAHAPVIRVLPKLRELIRGLFPTKMLHPPTASLGDLIWLLDKRIPPAQPLLRNEDHRLGMTSASFGDVLTAGWLYELGIGDFREEELLNPADEYGYQWYQATCQLVFKAIELQEAQAAVEALESTRREPPRWSSDPPAKTQSGVASGPFLIQALLRDNPDDRLFIVPYYGMSPVNSATLDLRLGNWFRIARRTRETRIDLSDRAERKRIRREAQQEEHVRFDNTFALHPGDFALGVSLEYVALPSDLMAFVEGKSGLGREGLIIATATQVAPGFKGTIVLELFNSGTVPLLLKPAMSIAQLVFVQTDRPLSAEWLYTGRFICQIKP
jgi:dCTP deaminase